MSAQPEPRQVVKLSPEARILRERSAGYQSYSLELKASVIAAIDANGGKVLPVCSMFDIPYDTVHYWYQNSDRYRQVQTTSVLSLADKMENLAHSTVDSLAAHDFSIVSARDKAAVLAVAIDKMQLLRGLPTSIVEDVHRSELAIILESAFSETNEQQSNSHNDCIDVKPVE